MRDSRPATTATYRGPGLALVEVLVCVFLLALVIIFVLNLLPSSIVSLQHAEDLESAAAYGQEVLDNARTHPPTGQAQFTATFGSTQFKITQDVYPVPGSTSLQDVVVTLQGQRGTPLVLGTRVPVNAP